MHPILHPAGIYLASYEYYITRYEVLLIPSTMRLQVPYMLVVVLLRVDEMREFILEPPDRHSKCPPALPVHPPSCHWPAQAAFACCAATPTRRWRQNTCRSSSQVPCVFSRVCSGFSERCCMPFAGHTRAAPQRLPADHGMSQRPFHLLSRHGILDFPFPHTVQRLGVNAGCT